MSYAPIHAPPPFRNGDFTTDGMALFSQIIVDELVKNKKIPMGDSPKLTDKTYNSQ
jgi:hypothetical protein